MASVKINAEKRDNKLSTSALRQVGKIPAVYYGRKTTSTAITIKLRDFEKAWKEVGETGVVHLVTSNGEIDALIHDTSCDPVTDVFRHADFYVFEAGQKMRVKVPVVFEGIAPAVKDMGGVLVRVMHELEIEAAPKDLPRRVSVDISPLVSFDSQIFAKDIKLPHGVTLIAKPQDVVASVYEPKEEVIAETVAPDLSTIEVEKKGKEAKEGEGAEGDEESPKAEKKDKK